MKIGLDEGERVEIVSMSHFGSRMVIECRNGTIVNDMSAKRGNDDGD